MTGLSLYSVVEILLFLSTQMHLIVAAHLIEKTTHFMRVN